MDFSQLPDETPAAVDLHLPPLSRILALVGKFHGATDQPGDPSVIPDIETALAELTAPLWCGPDGRLLPDLKLFRASPAPTLRDIPLHFAAGHNDLFFRLRRIDGALTESNRTSVADAKLIVFLASHRRADLAVIRGNLPAMLIAAEDFWDVQAATQDRAAHLAKVADALWEGHNVTAITAAPVDDSGDLTPGN